MSLKAFNEQLQYTRLLRIATVCSPHLILTKCFKKKVSICRNESPELLVMCLTPVDNCFPEQPWPHSLSERLSLCYVTHLIMSKAETGLHGLHYSVDMGLDTHMHVCNT